MAGEMNDAEFRLPSEFLADDFFMEEKGDEGSGNGGGDGGCWFPTEFPYDLGYGSNLSSPVESVTGTESSDEGDYMAGLTRQMAHYFLQDDEKGPVSTLAADNPKQGMLTVGSPQSTLCALGGLNASSRESSNGPSLVSSPPSTPLEPYKDDAWDLLYAAAGQVMRMRLNDEPEPQHNGGRGLLAPPAQKPSAPAPAAVPKNAISGYANLSLTQHHLRVTQYQQLKQQQMLKQQGAAAWSRQSRAKSGGTGGGTASTRPARPLGLSAAAWPPIQQPSRSGMRAVFLNPASRRESCGTGVFLPRRVDSPTELRKKPGCSTVLLPARVVQALNLNLDELGAHHRFPGAFALDHDAIIPPRSNAMLLQKRGYRHQPAPARLHHHHQQEICLPSEWTY